MGFVLIVDDEAIIREPIAAVLRSLPPGLATHRLEVLFFPFTISRFISAVTSLIGATPVTADRVAA